MTAALLGYYYDNDTEIKKISKT